MRRTISLTLAACLLGGVATTQAQQADRTRNADKTSLNTQLKLPEGFQMKDLKQIDNIRERLAKITNYALTKDDFGKVVDELAVFNRDQMKDWKNQDFKTIDGEIAQINKDWKAKYGHEFKMNADTLDDRFMIVQGVVTDPNVAAMHFPIPATSNEAQLAGSHQNANGGQVDNVTAQDLKDSKNVAIMNFPSAMTLPAIDASLVEEGTIGTWHFAVPKSTTSQQLHTQLQNELSYLGNDSSKWPATEADAYRLVAHRVLMALYNVNAPEASQRPNTK
jgi:hypothetical protein